MNRVMSKIWKVIVILAIVLLGLGIASSAVGYLTGASFDRMAEVRFGGWDNVTTFLTVLRDGFAELFKSYY